MVFRSRVLALTLATLAVLSIVATGIALAALSPGGTFVDDNGNIHEGNIEAIAAEGITKGCNPPTNDRYCPSSNLSRGQMAAFIRRALGLPSTSTDYFIDDNDSIFEGDINALAEAGITKGCNPPTSDRFCPDGTTTREQMAAFLRRAFDYPAATIDYFTDDDTSIFEADINAIAKAGVTLGCNPPTNNLYCPTDLVKRDQMASFFARALGLPPIAPSPPTTTPPPSKDITWSCTWNDFLSKYDCSGNVDKADPSDETWTCSWAPDGNLGSDWRCQGNIFDSSGFFQHWNGGDTWIGSDPVFDSYAGNPVESSPLTNTSWLCWNRTAGWECTGDVDFLDRVDEEWTCTWNDATKTWACDGQIDKSTVALETWSCTWKLSFNRWDCTGDEKREVMLYPIRRPPGS